MDNVRYPGYPRQLVTPIGKAYQVPIQYFFDKVLPPLHPDFDLDALIAKGAFRRRKRKREVVTNEGKMWGYSKTIPSSRKDVKEAYRWLQQGIQAIVNAIPTTTFRPLVFHNNGDGEAILEQRAADTLPDAFFLPQSCSPTSVEWTDIAVFGEYMKENSEESVQENIKKVTSSMQECMQIDPRRRYLYAFTVEDAAMKFWYCDRAQVVVSESFNFTEDTRTLIHFVLSLAFAELHQLGWDPTMIPITKDGETQYEISVRSEKGEYSLYRTLEVLADSTARHVVSRGTRVWKAVRIENGEATGDPVALKDAWVDSTRHREGYIHSQLMQSDYLSKEAVYYRKCFTTIQAHGDVYVADEQDCTPAYFKHKDASPIEPTNDGEASHTPHPHSAVTDESLYQVHYRIVYGEVGEPLADVTSLRLVFEILRHTIYGLTAMHKSGWVHRDLSTGNILVVNGIGKLNDLEYATSNMKQRKPGKVGTAYFVAVEVDAGRYLWAPSRFHVHYEEVLSDKDDANSDRTATPVRAVVTEEERPDYEFHYNPLHDLESLWWMAVYFITCREIDDGTEQADPTDDHTIAQLQAADELFWQCQGRSRSYSFDGYFAGLMKNFHPRLAQIASVLEEIRLVLLYAYQDAEKTLGSLTFDVAKDIYDTITQLLQKVVNLSGDIKIRRITSMEGSDISY